eukprot:TRINITY_DN5040_c0_g1_i1.p1 TRINITY_DN5040_c0_g1~~TRINITY_DN5040_c0_g1_i1.p1  ORF type:complete len:130 (+),score=19.84 TRINITY_DN5040_c0_g1_i1:192-581(+)
MQMHSTQVGPFIGTTLFMSPELQEEMNSKEKLKFENKQSMMDFWLRNDIYSMGLTILCMIGLRKRPQSYWNNRFNIQYQKLGKDIEEICENYPYKNEIDEQIQKLELKDTSNLNQLLKSMLIDLSLIHI